MCAYLRIECRSWERKVAKMLLTPVSLSELSAKRAQNVANSGCLEGVRIT